MKFQKLNDVSPLEDSCIFRSTKVSSISHNRSNTLHRSVVLLLDFVNDITAYSKMKPLQRAEFKLCTSSDSFQSNKENDLSVVKQDERLRASRRERTLFCATPSINTTATSQNASVRIIKMGFFTHLEVNFGTESVKFVVNTIMQVMLYREATTTGAFSQK